MGETIQGGAGEAFASEDVGATQAGGADHGEDVLRLAQSFESTRK